MIHFAVYADLVLPAPAAAGNVNAIAMAGTSAAVASVHSLTRIWPGRCWHFGSEVAMRLQAASSHVAPAGRTARYSGRTGFAKVDIGSSNSVPEIAVANTVAAVVAAVSGPAAVRRRIAAVETSVGIGVFAGTGAFAVEAAGSSAAVAAVMAGQIVVDGCNFAGRVAATGPGGFAADFAVAVGSRRKVRPWVAAAASSRPRSPSAPARTPRIAHSRPADRPRTEAA